MFSSLVISLMLSASQCTTFETDIIAAQNINIGTVSITNTTEQLILDIEIPFPWFFGAYHVYAGTGPLPTNSAGNVAPGQFPFSESFNYKHRAYTIVIDESDLGVSLSNTTNLLVAVHFEVYRCSNGQVVQNETAWAFGNPFSGNQWGWSFDYPTCSTGYGSRADLGLDVDQIKVGATSTVTATGAASGELVYFLYNNNVLKPNAGYTSSALGNLHLDLGGSNTTLAGTAVANSNGVAELLFPISVVRTPYINNIVAMQAVIVRGTNGLSSVKSNLRLMRLEG